MIQVLESVNAITAKGALEHHGDHPGSDEGQTRYPLGPGASDPTGFIIEFEIGMYFVLFCIQAIHHIFNNSIMELYEDAMNLSCDLTTKHISQDMYAVFQRDGFNYFSDMIPALHNYITVDTKAFLSSPDYMMAITTWRRSWRGPIMPQC